MAELWLRIWLWFWLCNALRIAPAGVGSLFPGRLPCLPLSLGDVVVEVVVDPVAALNALPQAGLNEAIGKVRILAGLLDLRPNP